MKNAVKRFSKMVAIMLTAIMALGAFPITAQANQATVTIIVDGRTLTQNADIGFATIIDGRTFVPLRLVAENMGVEVLWQDAGPRMITLISPDGTEVFHRIGDLNAYDAPIRGQVVASTDVASFVTGGRTMVGLRLIADALNAEVEWIGATRTVRITTATFDLDTPPVQPGVDLTQSANFDAWISEQRQVMQNTDFTDANRFFQVLVSTAPHQVENAFNTYTRHLERAVEAGYDSGFAVARSVLRADGPIPFDEWMEWRLLGWTYEDIRDGGPVPGQQPNAPRN